MSGKGISWAICKSAPRFRQITMPVPHHSVFYRPDALPAAQPTASKQKISPSPGRDWQANINAQSTHGCISRRISYLSYTQNSILYDTSRSCDGTGLLWQVATLLRELTCHTGSHSVTCHPTDLGDIPAFTPSRSWYSIKRPRRDARLS